MEINPSEITKIIKEQIKSFGDKAEVTEVGQSEMVLPEYMDWTMFKLERWLNLKMVQKEWHLILRVTMWES